MNTIFYCYCGFLVGNLFRLILNLFSEQQAKAWVKLHIGQLHLSSLFFPMAKPTYNSKHEQKHWVMLPYLEIITSLIFGLSALCGLTWTQLYLLCFSLLLCFFDLDSQEYPLLIWLMSFLLLLPFYSINLLTVLLLLLALLSVAFPINIGAGDFLYLANLALVVKLSSLLWIVQIASLIGILACLLLQTKKIPFIPYLTLGLMAILLFERLTGG
ncbi:TPA: peptidase [Streptococcus equi subsp. zooepidemicus]|uniref:Type IV leader peptidase family protein n=4 Tax=Streptococcus equi TaxID=1336 RepID=C0MD62_STRS7|nr:type IV leader peptidase family protein [Streptococcus equi subsp. zooepidemicus SzAM60]KIS20108.1 type IV leader peptidase family protein [Streptococcus equi subsp. zooepidemicus SzAM35]KIS21011.1 type IV leader peptidase family protein [Streptococcus equi subsp. zooepidemicus Sz35]MCD3404143.1 peptidase [Streptococcus equi subsp. zooepidemicus]VED85150.1 type IV leader peptidase family protein [Streptococcus equi subsp. equi]